MSGKRYFLDTNAIVSLLAGDQTLLTLLKEADLVAISVICELEFLSFPELSKEDRKLFLNFKERVQVVDLSSADESLKTLILAFRSSKKMKLPDAVIAATAKKTESVLLTADQRLLNHPDITSRNYTSSA